MKVEMFHGERFRTTDEFVNCLGGTYSIGTTRGCPSLWTG
ncbi:MAG: hypothetical protein HDR34_06805 [Treponema sp.]|nr:hypothetical protein [Treponema sp.]